MNSGPLCGFTVGVTADRRADEQIRLLSGRGARCVHGPVVRTHPLDSHDALRDATEALVDRPPDLVVLTTGIGVRGWLESAEALLLGDALRQVLTDTELVVRGPKAKGAVVTAGLDTAPIVPFARYDDIVDSLAERGVSGRRIAVQLDGGVASSLCRRLADLGADVVEVPVYRWSLPDDPAPAERLIRLAAEGRVDALTFTARPAVENLLEMADALGLTDPLLDALASRTVAVCVGPVCAVGLDGLGLPEPLVPANWRLGAMVQLMAGHFSGQALDLTLAGFPVRVQGRMVEVDGDEPAFLTDREQLLLATLAERPGVVHGKDALLRRVWGGDGDEHVVEVTIGRLRQRLGVAGVGIETVIRRGYRVSAS